MTRSLPQGQVTSAQVAKAYFEARTASPLLRPCKFRRARLLQGRYRMQGGS